MHPDLPRIAELLIERRDTDTSFWRWLAPGRQPSRKDANKFLLACMLDYQLLAATAWNNAQRLAESILGDPEDLWETITAMSLEDWQSRRKEYSLHRFPKGHERVYVIGRRVANLYGGDARLIWRDQTMEAVLYRLNDIGMGPQISRMVVGALFDTGQLEGKSDVKADIHVRRVLGRLLNGREYAPDEVAKVTDATRALYPANPWLLDRPLYRLGKSVCRLSTPICASCHMNAVCAYALS
ncbi:MAG: hypothetical protein NTU91_11080 [Chloroflexi bacterium]|nr:hypothetical protein [Chloroflexota bacterium]